MGAFAITARDADSRARAGVLSTLHGDVDTPAFVPLATKGFVRGVAPSEVAGLGYQMVLGNTFHLFLAPGHELIQRAGGLHGFSGWPGPIITDSGGFQIFSMGHGTVADEIKGRAPSGPERAGAVLAVEESGVRFRSYLDGAERELTPELSMAVQSALGSDIALVLDECTPFHISREQTARSSERTHRWLERCLAWHADHGRPSQLVYGIVQGGVHEDLRRQSAALVADSGSAGIAIGGSLGREKEQMHEIVGWATAELGDGHESKPRHLLGIGEIDDLIAGVELGIDTFDCAMPTRLGRHGVALVADPDARWRVNLHGARWGESREPVMGGCPCPTCAAGHTRAWLRHLLHQREPLAGRLLTLHNLAFVARVMGNLRAAIARGRLSQTAAALRAGAAP
ncbi:MAG: tRNA guanosine(34) transglycosylase Tgt [Solirubrobacteraceae bacterium]|nr:MAG: tRNA guanosine(34) transglycosylase Tgt [Solirubrobacterales bacterium]